MKKNQCILLFFLLTSIGVQAQFPQNANQTFYVCDTVLLQNTVSAFADGKGGTYSFWIDQRNGSASTSVYGQHLDSLGIPLWAANGKNFFTATGKEIWNMTAIQWQSGILIAWVQGPFGYGGDTLLCNYYDTSGTSQWAQPTVAANKPSGILGVTSTNLDIYPNSKGATITFGLEELGGNDYFSFNSIDFTGKLLWTLDTFNYQGGGDYYATSDDHHGGFYVAASTGGLGTAIYVGHFDSTGASSIASPVNISTVAGGRGEGTWNVLADNDGNGYVVWDDDEDVYIAKVKPDGTLAWGGGGAKSVCTFTGEREFTYAIMYGDTIYALWDDARPGAAIEYDIYMQKLDTAGNAYWTPNGIQLSNLSAYSPYPKLVKTGSNVVAGLELDVSFNGQQIRPDSSLVWQTNGVPVNISHPPFNNDYVLVSTGAGNVVAIWGDDADICAARIRPDGTLTHVAYLNRNSTELYPNPATDNFIVRLAQPVLSPVTISILNSLGEVMQRQQFAGSANGTYTMGTDNLAAGFYLVKIDGENYSATSKICVIRN